MRKLKSDLRTLEWMSEYRTIHDPFLGKDVQISDNLTDRLRGKYANGPMLPNGEPEFGWHQFDTPPIQHRAADRIDALVKALQFIADGYDNHDVNHIDFRVKAYQVALDALETIKESS